MKNLSKKYQRLFFSSIIAAADVDADGGLIQSLRRHIAQILFPVSVGFLLSFRFS